MRIAFVITRKPSYRIYAPTIEAALARGWAVECWHDYSQPRTGLKGYLFPAIESAPRFRNGSPLMKTYQGASELTAWLGGMQADAVVASGIDAFALPLPATRPLLVCQQFLIDSLAWAGPDGVLAWDLLALYSRWWLDWSAQYFAAEGLLTDTNGYLTAAAARSRFVGLPELDAARLIDSAEVRRRWGIPAGKPVVVLFPFPQGVGKASFWPRSICAEPSRLKQLANLALHRRLEYLRDVWRGWNDRNVVRALRKFCDRQGAHLVVKSREKTPVPDYTTALADHCVYDDSHYPATVLEALSIASLSVSYYSNSVFESALLGVPHLCVTYSAEDYNGSASNFFSMFYTAAEGSAFQFGGVSTAWSIAETLQRLPETALDDFTMDREAHARYVEKFLTHDSGDGGIRTIDAIERAFQQTDRLQAGAPA